MIIFLIIAIILIFAIYCYNAKLHINFKSFFKKGFKKYDDDYGMFCYTAEQRTDGKTFSMISTIDEMSIGKIVISNVKSFCEHRKNSLYMNDFNDIVDFFIENDVKSENYIIFFDEIFDAMGYGKLNRDSRRFLTQLRKRHLYLFTSCQNWQDLPTNFRKLCRYQVSCSMFNFLHLFAVSVNEINDGYGIKWDNELQEFVCPRLRTNIRKCALSTALSYDTYETIFSGSLISS